MVEKKKSQYRALKRGERKGKGDRDSRWGNGIEGQGKGKQDRRAGRGPRVGLVWPAAGVTAPVHSAMAKQLSVSILALGVAFSSGAILNKSLLFWERASSVVLQPWGINSAVQIYFLKAVRRVLHVRENRAFSGDHRAGSHHTNYLQESFWHLRAVSYFSCERGGLTFCNAGSLPF